MHWGRNVNLTRAGGPSSQMDQQQQQPRLKQLARAASLAAATRAPPSNGRISTRTHSSGTANNLSSETPNPPTTAAADKTLDSFHLTTGSNNNNISETTTTPSTRKQQKSISFAPSFMPTKSLNVSDQLEEETPDQEDFATILPTTTAHDVFSPHKLVPSRTKRRTVKGRAAVGPLATRLSAIRDALSNDSLRLNSGQYPFASHTSFDLNDPRKRARSYTDMTILSEPVHRGMIIPKWPHSALYIVM
jgi:hypothetical protein